MIRLSHGERARLVSFWAWTRIRVQIFPVVFAAGLMVLVQVFVLGVPPKAGLAVLVGTVAVIMGLSIFLEGLSLGLMPLGRDIGSGLAEKGSRTAVYAFALILGFGATLAEPAVAALKLAGSGISQTDSPLLHDLLHAHSWVLTVSIGIGVGLAILLGVARLYRDWKLKNMLFVLVPLTGILSALALLDPGLRSVVSLAWDAGAITTGPVTVPLVLSLGLGITKSLAKEENELSGFGIVTLASLLPVCTVLGGALILELSGSVAADGTANIATAGSLAASGLASVQAVIPLTLFLVGVLFLLRKRTRYVDEVAFGVVLALVGMFALNVGIENGLTRIGQGLGESLPTTIQSSALDSHDIRNFDASLVNTSIDAEGLRSSFFYYDDGTTVLKENFEAENFDAASGTYHLVRERPPIFGERTWGIIAILAIGLCVGFGITLAEPALLALGKSVEDLSVGTIRQRTLVVTVAAGVGTGLVMGLVMFVFRVPLLAFLLPSYAICLLLTTFSRESMTCIAWDSAGVTTGPVTVPLVLALGLGLGKSLGIADVFGLLALASAWPVITVLALGLWRNRSEKNRGARESV